MIARCLQEVESAVCIDRKIGLRVRGRPVVRGLRGGVHDELDVARVACKQALHAFGVADVQLLPAEAVDLVDEALRGRCGRCLGAKEVGPHVVLHTDYVEALRGEETHRL